jgi:7-keto-8-aminopelargonate synthetase-like enzyme
VHVEVEDLVARFVGKESSMIFSMGFGTNATIFPAFCSRAGCCNAILLDGVFRNIRTRAIRLSETQVVVLEDLVARFVGKESSMIFSMGFGTNATIFPALVSKAGCCNAILLDGVFRNIRTRAIRLSETQVVVRAQIHRICMSK